MPADDARMAAYEDALRGIAAAAIKGREHDDDPLALKVMLADVEHQLASLIVLGAVPPSRLQLPVGWSPEQDDEPPLTRLVTEDDDA